MFSKIEIKGLRGFRNNQTLNLAIPNGENSSGLTVIVGANNTGKSTIYEAFKAITQVQAPSFSEGKRNKFSENGIEIKITNTDFKTRTLISITNGSSETEFINGSLSSDEVKLFTLPSRRSFNPYFNKSISERTTYINQQGFESNRVSQLNMFSTRLFKIVNNQEKFNILLERVIGKIPKWTIDLLETGQSQYYLKFLFSNITHNSDGIGEGILSIFTIIDTLYDSNPGDLIFIDEPELSLHPTLQKNLFKLFLDYSKDRQIVISTHSPYFISWSALFNGCKIARTTKEKDEIIISQLSERIIKEFEKLLQNNMNPHILGLVANEIFFLDDMIILVEGQDDVVYYQKILGLIDMDMQGSFFGWGAGGAGNIPKFVSMFHELSFKKVVAIFDFDKAHMIKQLSNEYPEYYFKNIPTDDIRDKDDGKGKIEKIGLIDKAGKNLKEQYKDNIIAMFDDINKYLLN